MKNLLFWLLIAGVTAVILYFIADRWFPWMIAKFTSFLIGIFVVITGLFLRRRSKTTH